MQEPVCIYFFPKRRVGWSTDRVHDTQTHHGWSLTVIFLFSQRHPTIILPPATFPPPTQRLLPSSPSTNGCHLLSSCCVSGREGITITERVGSRPTAGSVPTMTIITTPSLSPPKKDPQKCNYTLASLTGGHTVCFRQTGLDIDTSSSPCLGRPPSSS
jgi:hypothetical protein